MEIRTELNYLRMSPRKVRLVADAIRGKSVPEAEAALRFLSRHAAAPVAKLLASAVADARQNFQFTSPAALVIRHIRVDGGPILKRSRPRAMGRSFPIHKHTSHITLILESQGQAPEKRRRRKADIALVKGGAPVLIAPEKRESAHTVFRERPKVITKPTGFVRRMFQRKAI